MKVGVIMGGISSEREISLKSGNEIVNALNKDKYEIVPIILNSKEEVIEKVKGIDIAVLALHGCFGEDGVIQGILETLNIPYTGCNVLSSAMCMDKDVTKRILQYGGVNTAPWLIVKSLEKFNVDSVDKIGYPVFVKPNSGGSSVATKMVENKEELIDAVSEALKYDKEVMVEKYIKGDEITCCVLNGEMLPIISIKPKGEFFDFVSKYQDGGAEEVVIELEKQLHDRVEDMALKSYDLLKCSVYSRVDMIISNGEPYVLEINTLPGMTKNSLFPISAKAVGISFSQLLDKIIEYSLEERGNKI